MSGNSLIRAFGLTLLLSAFNVCASEHESPTPLSAFANEGWRISEPLTISAIEGEAIKRIKTEAPRVPQVPFGLINAQWEVFKAKAQPGDVFVRLTSPLEPWQQLMGWDGYAIVRAHVVVARFTVSVN